MKRILILIPVLLLLASCSSTKEAAEQSKNPQLAAPALPPGSCRIVATVVKIEADRSSDAGSPCAKAPCFATVKVEEVLGYGSGFARTLHKSDEIRVQFRLTLSPTREILPDVAPPLPGLSVGSRFQTDITGGPAPGGVVAFQADRYQVK